MQIKVFFSGILAKVTLTDIKYYIDVKSIIDLRFRILDEFPVIAHYDFRFSINNEIINDNRELNEGDEVALIPTSAG